MLSSAKTSRPLVFQWTTIKGLTAIILFLVVAIIAEYFVVVYAMKLGVRESTLLTWNLQLPFSEANITVSISPLFHLVPIAVIISLASSWTYLTKCSAVRTDRDSKAKTRQILDKRRRSGFKGVKNFTNQAKDFFEKAKSRLLGSKSIAYLWRRIHFARATIKSAVTIILVFGALIILVSLFAHPQLVYRTVSGAYQDSPPLLNWVKSIHDLGARIAEVLGPIGWISSTTNGLLLSAAPAFKNAISAMGGSIKTLVDMDPAGKYLVYQNVATWVSALIAFLYGMLKQRSYRQRSTRKL